MILIRQVANRIYRLIAHQRTLEWCASIVTLGGQAFGSTTLYGAALYGAGAVFWWCLLIRLRMWGLVPLNIVSAVITGWNLYKLCLA